MSERSLSIVCCPIFTNNIQCGEPLTKDKSVCPKCNTTVNQSWFHKPPEVITAGGPNVEMYNCEGIDDETGQQCDYAFMGNERFCSKCGSRRPKLPRCSSSRGNKTDLPMMMDTTTFESRSAREGTSYTTECSINQNVAVAAEPLCENSRPSEVSIFVTKLNIAGVCSASGSADDEKNKYVENTCKVSASKVSDVKDVPKEQPPSEQSEIGDETSSLSSEALPELSKNNETIQGSFKSAVGADASEENMDNPSNLVSEIKNCSEINIVPLIDSDHPEDCVADEFHDARTSMNASGNSEISVTTADLQTSRSIQCSFTSDAEENTGTKCLEVTIKKPCDSLNENKIANGKPYQEQEGSVSGQGGGKDHDTADGRQFETYGDSAAEKSVSEQKNEASESSGTACDTEFSSQVKINIGTVLKQESPSGKNKRGGRKNQGRKSSEISDGTVIKSGDDGSAIIFDQTGGVDYPHGEPGSATSGKIGISKQEEKECDSTSEDLPVAPPGMKAWNKKTKEPDNLLDPQKQKSAQKRSQQKIMVHFYVVLPTVEFKYKPGDKVVVRFNKSELGGWASNQYVLHEERVVDETEIKLILMKGEVPMSCSLVHSPLDYKYFVVRGEKRKNKEAQVEYLGQKYRDIVLDRTLVVPPDKRTSDWHQYDGIMLTKPGEKGFVETLKAFFQSKADRTKAAGKAMLPPWQELYSGGKFSSTASKHRGEVFLEKAEQVCHCIARGFLNEDAKVDNSKLKEMLTEYVKVELDKYPYEPSQDLKETSDQAGTRLATACCIVHLAVRYELSWRHEDIQRLLSALLLRVDKNTNGCVDYEHLITNYFPSEKWQKNIVESLMKAIVRLVPKGAIRSDIQTKWLFVVPLIHFLKKQSVYRRPSLDVKAKHDDISGSWWGISDFNEVVATFKEYMYYQANENLPNYYLKWLGPLFKVDQLMPRTLLAVMSLKHLPGLVSSKCFPPDALLANCFYFTRSAGYGFEIEKIESVLHTIPALLERALGNIDSTSCKENLITVEADLKSHYQIAREVFVELLSKYARLNVCKPGVIVTSISLTAMAISNLHSYCAIVETCDDVKKDVYEKILNDLPTFLESLWNSTRCWLNTILPSKLVYSLPYCWPSYNPKELELYNELFEISFTDSSMSEMWRSHIETYISERLLQLTDEEQVNIFCIVDFKNLSSRVESCFSAAAFKVLESSAVSHTGNFKFVFDAADNGREAKKIRELLSKMFDRAWPRDVKCDSETIVTHMLSWPSFSRFLTLFYGRENKMNLLSDSCQENITAALSIFDNIVATLLSGQITISLLKLLLDKEDSFLLLFKVVEHNSESGCPNVPNSEVEGMDKTAVLQKILSFRRQELHAFNENTDLVREFVSACGQFKPKFVSDLLQKLNINHDDLRMISICKPCMYSPQLATTEELGVVEQYYSLTQKAIEMMIDIVKWKHSVIFRQLWHRSIERANKMSADFSLTDILSEVWNPVNSQWKQLCSQLISGNMTLDQLNKAIEPLGRTDDAIKREFEIMCGGDKKITSSRLEETKRYHQLNNCQRGAELMLELRDEFGLLGDFSTVETLQDLVNDTNMPMRSVTENLFKSGKQLEGINDEKLNCLHVFLNNKSFVAWLKKSMKGPKEVKVLVDLAMISAAGQGDLEVHRVSCLHAAATGYAPLIYDLKPDCNFHQFLQLCQQVWQKLEVDPGLPKKFSDTARQLDWLDRVKKSHGSVEVNALTSVQSINQRGIYTVGALRDSHNRKSVDGVIKLQVKLSKDEENVEPGEGMTSGTVDMSKESRFQTLKLQQLNDLQSKLMLVAGKSQDGDPQVEQFVEMLDGVTRLANIYIKLCAAGCALFQNFRAIFYCDRERPGVCTRIEFSADGKHGFGERGQRTRNDVVGHVNSLCDLLDKCLDDWLTHISDCRDGHPPLNHFTTAQLVLLQNELVKVGTMDERDARSQDAAAAVNVPAAWVYPLLKTVRKGCTLNNLEVAMREAFRRLAEKESSLKMTGEQEAHSDLKPDCEMSEEQIDEVEMINEEKEQKKREFLDKMMELFSKKLAINALKEVGADVDAGILWCMDHNCNDDEGSDDDDDVDDDVMESSSVDVEYQGPVLPSDYSGFHRNATKESVTADLFQSVHIVNESLDKRLSTLWDEYKSEMDRSLSDFLSLKHLGTLLELLTDSTVLNRPMSGFLKSGTPNLVVCSTAEILPTVLSLYMHEKGNVLALPSTDEILMCNAKTTAEEIELLWRRAAHDARSGGSGRIYSLVHAEKLDYEASRQAENSLDKHSHTVSDLRLVVVCCGGEREERCHMISALERYRVRVPTAELNDVREYLKQHLTVENVHGLPARVRPAAELDPERCCIRVMKSHRAGVGKSLRVRRLTEEMDRWQMPYGAPCVRIPLHCKSVDTSCVVRTLRDYTPQPGVVTPHIFHIDVAHEVLDGVDYLLFNLLVLGSLTDCEGFVWCRSEIDYYVVETMPLLQHEFTAKDRMVQRQLQPQNRELQYVHHVFSLLPSITCWSPRDSLLLLTNRQHEVEGRYSNAVVSPHDQQMDNTSFLSEEFQRPFQYLQRYTNRADLQGVDASNTQGDHQLCIETLLAHCGIQDPSWAELRHFAEFLNIQLKASEKSIFCSPLLAPDLPGFLNFVVRFMIKMSKDFATRSLTISEETPEVAQRIMQEEDDAAAGQILELYGLKRRWETSPHPYLFFNADGNSFTFMGFIVQRQTGNILEPGTNIVLDTGVVPQQLQVALAGNMVNLGENFDSLERHAKIIKMCSVMGVDMQHDPDDTYELTADNVKKILAIYMRFRCNIPVIVMGETGCGKTRLIKFMCDLWKPPGSDVTNMLLMKVHGGTTTADILRKVNEAVELADINAQKNDEMNIQTVLFFDEANTTEAIGLIKEIMCDRTMNGAPVHLGDKLKLIAACNPYRKHSDDMIGRLEHAGLGYHIQANETTDRLGRIPMRQLVYRVQALPQSMLPLVWDFGQLNRETETLYIRQMVHRHFVDMAYDPQYEVVISDILAYSQEFMRIQEDECSFVSLRDVDRTLEVMVWFYEQREELFHRMNRLARRNNDEDGDDDYDSDDEYDDAEDVENAQPEELNEMTRALILALGVCYHACLQKREEYRQYIAPRFVAPMTLTRGAETIAENISWCQDVFLDEIEPGENIAKNQALKENVFMMIVCIELRIPLFLVGKPGSSKSLAKTIVADAMQGEAAKSELFRSLKSIHMVSYQCSPLSTAEGIVGTFRQCAQLQENQNLDKFVSIVVLDEVGLAEDSDRMPLKALHPLLEDGCEGDEKPAPHKKVGFIGISNWALDPAKMNRGILVQRGVPDEQELEQSARGICSGNRVISPHIGNLLEPMAKAYLELYNSALEIREFFGLRDFYSLVKMVYGFAARSRDVPTWYELQHAILRNFGGLDGIGPVEVFAKHLPLIKKDAARKDSDPACDPASLIRASLHGDNVDSESRYLLLLTENYAALGILQNELLNIDNAIIIFGSSFPRDQEYTQVCRNINRIKICMETGRTVVLLNLENLYESLYDALNQYYVTFGDQRFVDLGLGTQRVKCRVDKKFRLIVVAEKQVVYHKFPIPLINRLEKHFLAMTTMLTTDQLRVVEKLTCWCKEFSGCNIDHVTGLSKEKLKIGDVFIGYHDDAPASVILDVCQRQTRARIWSSESGGEENVRRGEGDTAEAADRRDILDYNKVLEEAKDIMLCCATPESLVRLSGTSLARDQPQLYKRYTVQQKHSSVHEFLHHVLVEQRPKHSVFVQLTTHSRLLQRQDVKEISRRLQVRTRQVSLQNLHAFGTEQQFCRMLRDFMLGEDRSSSKATVATATPSSTSSVRLLLLQCDSGDTSADLIACARYNIWNEYTQLVARGNEELGAVTSDVIIHVVLVVQLPRIAGGCFVGFQGGKWTSYHIDDLHPDPDKLPPLIALSDLSISSLFERALMRGRDASTPEQAQRVEQPREESMGFTSEQRLGDSRLPGKPDRDEGEMDVSPVEILVNPTEEMLVNPTEQMLVNPTEQMLVNPTEQMLVNPTQEIVNMDTEMGSDSTVLEDSKVDTQLELDVSQIIRNCIHGAVAMIKDPPSVAQISRNRKTQRLNILLQLTRDDQSLMAVLKKRVSLLLKDKEQTAMTSELARSWLRNDAASFKSICKAGTFRRSMWQCLESRVTPLLAGLIAYFASNSNLELLSAGIPDPKDRDDTMESTAWIERMWFNMIMDSDVTSIAYRDLQTAMQKGELTDFEIKSTGRGGFQFAAKLPFSWVIKSRVDAAVQKAKQQPQYPQLETEDPEELTERLLAKRPLGRILNVAYAESGAKERVVSCYLHDFVCMIYTPQSKYHAEELKLIADDIMNSARRRVTEESYGRQDTVDTTTRDRCLTIPGIHLTYDAIHSRIELFSQLAQEFSECVLTLFKSKAIADSPLDLRALIMLLETMSPQKDTLNDENERRKWIERVSHFTPLVSRLLESVSISCLQGQDMKHQDTCRFTWNKIRALQMFIEHVCVRGSDDQRASVQKCMLLWTFLGDTVDFKKVTSLEKLEKFLTVYNSNVVEKYFGKMDKCSGCEESAGEPIELPCRHIVCRPCLLEMKEVEMLNCPRQGCNGAFQADMKFEIIAAKRQQVKLYSLYKNRINTFYMDLVSRLCFSGDTPPESQVIKKLMGYVTRSAKLQDKLKSAGIQTRARAKSHVIKKLVMFDEGFDPTPVVRSFFLQLLLRSSFEEVKEYLEDYLDSARHLIHSNPQHIMELCALCIQCLEDYHHGQGVQSESDRDILQSVSRMLLDAGRMNMDTGITMLKLEWVGRVRYCLSVTADWIYRFYLDEGEPERWRHLEIEVRTLCDRAAALCDGNLKWPRLYLMKLLVRRYGMDVLHKVKLEPVIKWLLPREALQTAENDRLPDRFVVLGDEYKALRELIAKIVLGEDCSALEGQLKTLKIEAGKTERLLLLALFREVTSTYGYQDISRRPNKETEKKLLEFCDATPFITNKALAKKLMTNHQDADWLRVIPHREAVDLGLAEVIIHLKMIIEGVTGKTSLYKPYTNIILEPRSMGKSYLPTMPQDELGEVREAVLQARNANENPVFYQCPNGHPYVIGNCGRPATHGACNQCGLPIGGGGYQLLPGNTQIADNKADNTAPGHILGTARAWTSVPERGLSPASVAVLRILLHMSMYLGAVDHNQEISKVIVPRVADDQVKNFLWQHIRADLEAAAKAIGRSRDDVMILLHQLIDRSATTPQPAVTGLDDKLRSKQARQTWETSFATNNIIALVQGLNERLQTANNKIVNDDRLGSNPVMRLLYEVDGGGSVQQGPGVEVEDMVAVWRYRSRVSLEHMSQELHESTARCGKKELPHPVLRSFLRRVQELKALRLLPSVVRLHQLLLHKLNRRIHIAEATSTTLGTFLLSEGKTDEHNREELENLVRQFSTTWSYIRKHLEGYAFKGQQLLEEHAPEEIGTDTRLAVLLPSLRGWGLCSVALVFYLTQLQNDFMEEYSKLTKQKLETIVSVQDANLSHLIAFHEEKDIQPIILANCNYSLEMGCGTKVEYDFAEMEAQIVERFIRGRPRLDFQMDFIAFREDFTNAAVFLQLRALIPQIALPNAHDVESALQQKLPEVNDLLTSLDIVIGFLVSVGGEADSLLVRFMADTLKMKSTSLLSVIDKCQLKHVEALWMLLSFIRARVQVNNGQEAFEGVDQKYRERLPVEARKRLCLGLQHVNMDVFLPLLYECIVMRLTVKQDVDQEDYIDNADQKLKDAMFTCLVDERDMDIELLPILADDRFPAEISVRHCIDTWKVALHPKRRHDS